VFMAVSLGGGRRGASGASSLSGGQRRPAWRILGVVPQWRSAEADAMRPGRRPSTTEAEVGATFMAASLGGGWCGASEHRPSTVEAEAAPLECRGGAPTLRLEVRQTLEEVAAKTGGGAGKEGGRAATEDGGAEWRAAPAGSGGVVRRRLDWGE
jgi:hypothetical protein